MPTDLGSRLNSHVSRVRNPTWQCRCCRIHPADDAPPTRLGAGSFATLTAVWPAPCGIFRITLRNWLPSLRAGSQHSCQSWREIAPDWTRPVSTSTVGSVTKRSQACTRPSIGQTCDIRARQPIGNRLRYLRVVF